MLARVFTLLAVIALAVSTWLISGRHRPGTVSPQTEASLPGYTLKDAILTDFDASGAPTLRIHADRIDQIDHGTEVTLYHVRFDYQSPNGQSWVMFGDTAQVEPGGQIMDVAGNVRIEGHSTEQ